MFDTPAFWLALVTTCALSHAIPARLVRLRAVIIFGAGAAVLWGIIGLRPLAMVLVAASIVWVYAATRATQGLAERRPLSALALALAPVVLVWVVGKEALVLGVGVLRPIAFVGISYLFVKAWTFAKDVHDGRIERFDLATVAAYLVFFPTYVAGPMHLYGEFADAISSPAPLDGETVVECGYRTMLGLVKVKVIAPILAPLGLASIDGASAVPGKALLVACAVYSLVLYADFSGYSDLAVATSRLMGVKTPENFRNPYASPNIREFWQRWHVTFSRVLTSYVFVPVSRALSRRLDGSPRTVMASSYLVTFVFCGFWHGPTANLALWGAYHGAGLVAYDLYRPWAAKRNRARRLRPQGVLRRSVARAAAVAVTFAFVSVGWTLFVLPVPAVVAALRP